MGLSESMKRLVGGLRESVPGIKGEQCESLVAVHVNGTSLACFQVPSWMFHCSAAGQGSKQKQSPQGPGRGGNGAWRDEDCPSTTWYNSSIQKFKA